MKDLKFIKHISACFAIMLAFAVNTHATTGETFTGDGSRKRERSVENISPSDRAKIEGKIEMLLDEGLINEQILTKLKPKYPNITLEKIEKIRSSMGPAE